MNDISNEYINALLSHSWSIVRNALPVTDVSLMYLPHSWKSPSLTETIICFAFLTKIVETHYLAITIELLIANDSWLRLLI